MVKVIAIRSGRGRPMINAFPSLAAFEGQHPAVHRAPDDEIPRRAVPEPAEQHRDDEIGVGARERPAISAQRNVKIFAQPGGERDVPASPEIGDRFRAIRRIEILRENEPEHEPEPDRHVGVAAEIEIDLEGVGDRPEPGVERADRAGIEGGVGNFSAGIREQDFLRQAEHEKRDAARKFLRGEGAMLQLLGEEGELQDRSRDQMREHGNEAGEIDEIGHRFRFPAIDIDRVTERLEGVEADPEREDDAEEGVELHVGPAEALARRRCSYRRRS